MLVQIQNSQNPPTGGDVHLFESTRGAHVWFVPDSSLFDLDEAFSQELGAAEKERLLQRILPGGSATSTWKSAATPLRALSLNVAQACNLGCSYCYAAGGEFGANAAIMDWPTAKQSIDLLFKSATPGEPLLLGFMGGEPLMNRAVLHAGARYAADRAARLADPIRFTVTTNGTLLTREDAALFNELPWTVQFSLDGDATQHDRQRPMKDGRSSYGLVRRSLEVLADFGGPERLVAKATVGRNFQDLPRTLEHLIALGFDDVGFSPVLTSTPQDALDPADLARFLREMIACGEDTLARWKAGQRYPFSNLTTALERIHSGSRQNRPCGAVSNYLSVSADGELYACHRFVNDSGMRMGSLDEIDDAARTGFLAQADVDRIEPCRSCWARYLCGGGCYHEVKRVGRPACDYIRGWLDFCLRAYVEMESYE